jgi:hypothetical protein
MDNSVHISKLLVVPGRNNWHLLVYTGHALRPTSILRHAATIVAQRYSTSATIIEHTSVFVYVRCTSLAQ